MGISLVAFALEKREKEIQCKATPLPCWFVLIGFYGKVIRMFTLWRRPLVGGRRVGAGANLDGFEFDLKLWGSFIKQQKERVPVVYAYNNFWQNKLLELDKAS